MLSIKGPWEPSIAVPVAAQTRAVGTMAGGHRGTGSKARGRTRQMRLVLSISRGTHQAGGKGKASPGRRDSTCRAPGDKAGGVACPGCEGPC